jgi:Transposase IS66 family
VCGGRSAPGARSGPGRVGCKAAATGSTITWAAKAWCTWPALAHARRKFFDAVKLNAQDVTSIRIVAQMDALFALDAPAPAGALSLEARHELRLQKAPPLLEQLKARVEAARAGALPQRRWPRPVLHPDAVGPADPVFGLSGGRTVQQRFTQWQADIMNYFRRTSWQIQLLLRPCVPLCAWLRWGRYRCGHRRPICLCRPTRAHRPA